MDPVTIVGLAAAIGTTVSFVPQAIKTIKTKDTSGLSLKMYTTFTIGIVLWLVYGVLKKDIPIIIANVITLLLCSTILFMIFRYKKPDQE